MLPRVSPILHVGVICIAISLLTTVPPSLAQSPQQNCSTLTVNSSLTLQQAVNFSLSSMTLQPTINLSLSVGNTSCSACIRIELPAGQHTLTAQTLFPTENREIEFVGLGDNVSVSCDYAVRSNYTWSFNGLCSVRLRGIHFEGCPRPLRLENISDVAIQDCSFRYT